MSRIGFIGLGNVGRPAAINLLRAGFHVHGFDLRPCAEFGAENGVFVEHVRDLAEFDVLVQSLPSAAALVQTIDALLPSLRAGQVLIELSSYPLPIKVQQAQRLRERGVHMLDCEVSGLPAQVERRDAVLFVAGDRSAVGRVESVFNGITNRHIYLGEFGMATKMKLIANTMVCVHNLMAAEALNLGRLAGLDPTLMIEALGPSAAGSSTFANKAPLMIRREFAQGRGPFRHMFGYLQRARELALSGNAHTPLLNAARAEYAKAEQQLRHDEDIAAIIEIIESEPSRKCE